MNSRNESRPALIRRPPRPESTAVIRTDDPVTARGVALLLRERGGLPGRSNPLRFGFASEAGRDRAMDRARERHGWTVVEAEDDGRMPFADAARG